MLIQDVWRVTRNQGDSYHEKYTLLGVIPLPCIFSTKLHKFPSVVVLSMP